MSGGLWRPAHGHCSAVLSCPGNCECGAKVRAELKAEAALLDEQNNDGTDTHNTPQSPLDGDCEPPAATPGPFAGIRDLVTAMKFRGNGQ